MFPWQLHCSVRAALLAVLSAAFSSFMALAAEPEPSIDEDQRRHQVRRGAAVGFAARLSAAHLRRTRR